jgi:hypothetical protein
MEALGGERRYSSYTFLTSALDGGEWSASRPSHALAPGREPLVPIVQETVSQSRSGYRQNPLLGIEPRSPSHPAHSQKLYWLSYPAHGCVECYRVISVTFLGKFVCWEELPTITFLDRALFSLYGVWSLLMLYKLNWDHCLYLCILIWNHTGSFCFMTSVIWSTPPCH